MFQGPFCHPLESCSSFNGPITIQTLIAHWVISPDAKGHNYIFESHSIPKDLNHWHHNKAKPFWKGYSVDYKRSSKKNQFWHATIFCVYLENYKAQKDPVDGMQVTCQCYWVAIPKNSHCPEFQQSTPHPRYLLCGKVVPMQIAMPMKPLPASIYTFVPIA